MTTIASTTLAVLLLAFPQDAAKSVPATPVKPAAAPAQDAAKRPDAPKPLKLGDAAPEFKVDEWVKGEKFDSLESGKVHVLEFWATWCGPCRATIPELNKWQAEFKDDLVIIGLSNEKPEVVKTFMETTAMKYSIAIDTQARTSKTVGVKGIPHAMVITPDGVVRWQGFPGLEADPLTTEKLKSIIAEGKALARGGN